MQRKAIAALMISLLLLSACGHGAGEQTFEAFRDTLTGKLVTVTAQVRVQRGDTVTDYTLTCQELPDGYDLTVTAPEQAAGVTAHLRDGASTLAFDDIILPAGDLNGAGHPQRLCRPDVDRGRAAGRAAHHGRSYRRASVSGRHGTAVRGAVGRRHALSALHHGKLESGTRKYER